MVDIKLNTEDLLRLLFVRMDGKCYTIAAEQTAVEVENHEPFGAKWSMFCRLKVRSYVLAANVAGTLKVAPLQILKFPVVLPHKFLDAEKFNLRFSDASEITEIADKLRWYRYQKGLRQRDAADYAGIDRSTYIHYEEAGRDFYPKEHMEKLAELFEVQKAAISKHLKNIFASGELREDSVVSVLETTAADGKNYPTRYYNLDAIIAVGYRVNSKKATMFRIWANRILKEYIIKGYVMDDERLKEPQNFFGKDYFEEQLERIRDIRASERRFYQKITDIYSQCSADYDVDSPVTKEFFATVQNKLHYAITKHTAAEIIYDRADSTKPNMGLTTWKNAPSGRIRKSDVVIAKNYLDETEMGNLNEIVTMYLDYAERQARRGNIMYMQDWVARLDAFLQFNEEEVLHHKGKVTAAIAKAFAESEFEKYRVIQDRQYQSDFDRLVASTEEKD